MECVDGDIGERKSGMISCICIIALNQFLQADTS